MKTRGFTLIELMIVIAIIGMVAIIAVTGVNSGSTLSGINSGSTLSAGWNGLVEERCINGYKFVLGSRGRGMTQIVDDQGHGVKCN
jgi:prepilin-type N-terminal cleavage/methylation domain-containing protein